MDISCDGLGQPIRLTRRFAIISAAVILTATVTVALYYRASLTDQLARMAERNNADLTMAFGNSVWPRFAEFVAGASRLGPDGIRRHPRTAELRRAVAALMAGTPVLKVKLYDISGFTVFSTDPRQIGQSYRDNPRFLQARAGGFATEMERRRTFDSFDGRLYDRHVLSSYVPVRRGGANGTVEGVAEIYRDVTAFRARVAYLVRVNVAVIAAAAVGVFVLLLLTVWTAERAIRFHHARNIELTRNVAKAEAANKAKTEFLATMSHELRTPLNVVIGMSEIMQREAHGPLGNACYKDHAGDIHESGKHLLHIIDDVLEFAHMEGGALQIAPEATPVAQIVEAACRQVARQAEAAGVRIASACPPGLPDIVSDPRRLCRVLVNLLSNAVKFTPKGGEASMRVKSFPDADAIMISVSDTGVGIRQEDFPLALASFGQVDSSLSRPHGGAGLGLPLSLRLVESLGGTLDIKSAPGAGTTVTVTLPVHGPVHLKGKATAPAGAVSAT